MVDNESVDKICGQIEEDGDREIKSIIDKARQTAADIIGRAEREGNSMAEKVLKEAKEKGQGTRRRLLSSVNLEVKRAKLRTREEVVSAVYEKVESSLEAVRERGDYPQILTGLIAEAVRALEGNEFMVYVDRVDLSSLESVVFPAVREEMGREGRKIGSFEAKILEKPSLGGARVGVPGGNVIFDNTFEARMYRLRDEIRNIVFEEIFS